MSRMGNYDYCPDFDCAHLGKCINKDNLCKDLQCCHFIRALGRCTVCLLKNVCYKKEVYEDAGND